MYKYVKEIGLFGILPFILDRWTKYAIVHGLIQDQDLLPVLKIYSTYNSGVAWGMASELQGFAQTMLLCFVGAVLAYFIWTMTRINLSRSALCATVLIVSGGISNFIDRFLYDGVVDWICVYYQSWTFPIFNGADIFITLGAAWLVWLMIRSEY